jgi:AraC-like DNA-binding protein
MKTNRKTDEIIIKQIANRVIAKRRLHDKLIYEIGVLQEEKERIWYTDRVEDLAKEFGVSKATVSRICKGIK